MMTNVLRELLEDIQPGPDYAALQLQQRKLYAELDSLEEKHARGEECNYAVMRAFYRCQLDRIEDHIPPPPSREAQSTARPQEIISSEPTTTQAVNRDYCVTCGYAIRACRKRGRCRK